MPDGFQPIPGRFKVYHDDSDGHYCVVFIRTERPDWWQVVARFSDAERADRYADVEQMILDDEPDQPCDDLKAEPPKMLPPPTGLTTITELMASGEWKRPGGVLVAEPAAAESTSKHAEEITPEPAETKAPEPDPGAEEITPAPPPAAPKKRGPKRGTAPQRRFTEHKEPDPESVKGLADDHPAVVEGRTLFPTTVVDPEDSPRLLVSGHNNAKLGDRVSKGAWKGMPIYALTLEERATCPESCHHWLTCFGNGMPQARRHRPTKGLRWGLTQELAKLNEGHPDGFVVRLHVLGDFYDKTYAQCWGDWLEMFPALRCFGYTAWPRSSDIGKVIAGLTAKHWDRFAIRFSDAEPKPQGATTIWRKERGRIEEGIVCPAETGDTDCCGSCGLCWAPEAKDQTIVFMAHGPSFKGRAAKAAEATEFDAKGRALTGRAHQYWQWLQGLANAGGRLPWTKTSTAELAGIPKGSIGYVYDVLTERGFIVAEDQTRDGGWSLTLKDGVELRSAPRGAEGANPGPENIAEKTTEPAAPEQPYRFPEGKNVSPPPAPARKVDVATLKSESVDDWIAKNGVTKLPPASAAGDKPIKEPTKKPHSIKTVERTGCASEGCTNTRQPGRDHCAVCLTANAPERKRANMRDSYI